MYKLVGITSCPTGIAHTYMTAEAITKVARKHGMTVRVETQGQLGQENVLSTQDFADADAIVLACGITPLEPERWAGLEAKVLTVHYDDILKDPERVISGLRTAGLLG
jgi:fructose-specific phosphotransferase system IIB component